LAARFQMRPMPIQKKTPIQSSMKTRGGIKRGMHFGSKKNWRRGFRFYPEKQKDLSSLTAPGTGRYRQLRSESYEKRSGFWTNAYIVQGRYGKMTQRPIGNEVSNVKKVIESRLRNSCILVYRQAGFSSFRCRGGTMKGDLWLGMVVPLFVGDQRATWSVDWATLVKGGIRPASCFLGRGRRRHASPLSKKHIRSCSRCGNSAREGSVELPTQRIVLGDFVR